MGEIQFTNGIIMGAVFSLCILLFAVNFAIDNESEITTASDVQLMEINTSLRSELVSFKNNVDSVGESFQQENVESGTDVGTSGGQFKVTINNVKKIGQNLSSSGFKKIFGNNSEFGFLFTILGAVIFLMFIRYGYKTWFGRNPD